MLLKLNIVYINILKILNKIVIICITASLQNDLVLNNMNTSEEAERNFGKAHFEDYVARIITSEERVGQRASEATKAIVDFYGRDEDKYDANQKAGFWLYRYNQVSYLRQY